MKSRVIASSVTLPAKSRTVALKSALVCGALLAIAAACSAGQGTKAPILGSSGGSSGDGGSTGGSPAAGGSGASSGTGSIVIDSGSNDAAASPDGGCAYATVKSDLQPANLLFVVDRSGSMNCNLPPITSSTDCEANPVQINLTQPSKWDVVKQGLKGAFALLPVDASAGLSFFTNNDLCGVNSMPSVEVNPIDAAQIGALDTALDAVAAPKGGTAIVGATILAYQHLHQEVVVAGNEFVVLLTDGAETCSPDKAYLLETEIPKAVSVGIRTFVIGAPGSENARAMLSEMAYLGGTARDPSCDHTGTPPDAGDCHFDMTKTQDFAADLSAALAAISGKALTCDFDVPAAPDGGAVDFNRVNVVYTNGDGQTTDVLKDTTAGCDSGAQGWQYLESNTKIRLCGSICDEVTSDPKARVDIVLGCETQAVR